MTNKKNYNLAASNFKKNKIVLSGHVRAGEKRYDLKVCIIQKIEDFTSFSKIDSI